MTKKHAHKVSQDLKASYSAIAVEFHQTRLKPWPEFDHFLAYTRKHAKVLDLGCGSGRLYAFLQQKQVSYLGIDHNSHLLDIARKNYSKGHFQLDDIMDLELEKEAFDNVFCIAAFHHVPSKEMRQKVLKDVHETLKPDGIFILTVWNLFQIRYLGAFFRSLFKGSWNDVFIKWGDYPNKRYYHAFLPGQLRRLIPQEDWKIEEFYFTRKGKRVRWFRSFNLVMILRKK